jgi:hypothetical protein
VFPLLLAMLRRGIQYTELVFVSRPPKLVVRLWNPSESVFVNEFSKRNVSRIQEATSAIVLIVIVTCVAAVCSYNLHSE